MLLHVVACYCMPHTGERKSKETREQREYDSFIRTESMREGDEMKDHYKQEPKTDIIPKSKDISKIETGEKK